MAVSEKCELLGRNLYSGTNIPPILTLTSIPTASELDYVAAEDFDETMLESILPKAVEEKGFKFDNLLEMDYYWVLRCLRILNYGPYHMTNTLFCPHCGHLVGDYKVDLRSIEIKPLPEDIKTKDIVIPKDEFIDFKGDVVVNILTIRETLNARKDEQFKGKNGKFNSEFARMCYAVKRIGPSSGLTPIEARLKIQSEFSAADYQILKNKVKNSIDYGLRAGGRTVCPKCGNKGAVFTAMVDDRYFRPTMECLRAWKNDTSRERMENTAGSKAANVRKHN